MTPKDQMANHGSIEMRGTLPDFQDDGLDREVKAIISAIADLGGKIIVRVRSPHRHRIGCFDLILGVILLILAIGAGA